MTTSTALFVALTAITAFLAVLGIGIVAVRAARHQSTLRRARIVSSVRPALLRLLAEDDPPQRAEQLSALLATIDDSTWRALEPTVTELLGKLRGEAHATLREMVERQGTVEWARRRVDRPGAVGRARAAEVLGGLEDPDVTDALVRLLHDRDAEVRQVAARALGRSGDPRGAAPVLGCIRHRSVPPRVVSQALLRLGAGGHPALVAALDMPDELSRAVAVEILGLSGAVAAAPNVARCLREDPSIEVRIRAARALGKVGARSSLDALLDATEAGQPAGLRAVAARALGDLGHPGAIPTLRALLDDPVHRVASNAGRALAALGSAGNGALQEVVDAPASVLSGAHALEALSRARLIGLGAR